MAAVEQLTNGENETVALTSGAIVHYGIEVDGWITYFKARSMGITFAFHLDFHELFAALDLQNNDSLMLERDHSNLSITRTTDKVLLENIVEVVSSSFELSYADFQRLCLQVGLSQARILQLNPHDFPLNETLESSLGVCFVLKYEDLAVLRTTMAARWDALQAQ